MDPTRKQFITEAGDIVDRLYADLQQLRARRTQGRQRRELASRIFRHVHTLKGSAGSLGISSVSNVAHEFEGVLDGVRLGRVNIDDGLLNLFEETTDQIAAALVSDGQDDAINTHSLMARLHTIASEASQKGMIASNLRAALPEEIARALSEYDLQHAREAVREGAKLFIVDAGFAIETFDRDFRTLTAMLGESGEVISTVPGAPSTSDEINLRLLYAAELITSEVRPRAEAIAEFACREIELDYDSLASGIAPPVSAVVPESVPSTASVRVALRELDELTASVTDLLRDTTSALSAMRDGAVGLVDESTNADLRPRFLQLEERLIKLRLMPLSDLLNGTAARAGRAAARQIQKEIEFEIVGGEVGIDKSLAETIAEPLMHLVRNAVSHGIEPPNERTATGKPAAGRVTLHGFSEGSRIYIVVSDDGRGIDFDRVAQSAAEQGIVNRPEELTTDQALRLIFRPGFSTSKKASDLSGRGVGLEIVDQAMAQAGGEVRVTSRAGQGTIFVMIIPATLALAPCVIVRSGEQFFCLDAGVVTDQLTWPESPADEHFDWQGDQLSLLHLREILAQDVVGQKNGPRSLLICKQTEHRPSLTTHQKPIAIVVDEIAGQHQTLVRSLGPHAGLWHGISGAAEMMDGNVALMIDLARLIEAYES
jgi:two-component system chemotaxis sensor kinase CheA